MWRCTSGGMQLAILLWAACIRVKVADRDPVDHDDGAEGVDSSGGGSRVDSPSLGPSPFEKEPPQDEEPHRWPLGKRQAASSLLHVNGASDAIGSESSAARAAGASASGVGGAGARAADALVSEGGATEALGAAASEGAESGAADALGSVGAAAEAVGVAASEGTGAGVVDWFGSEGAAAEATDTFDSEGAGVEATDFQAPGDPPRQPGAPGLPPGANRVPVRRAPPPGGVPLRDRRPPLTDEARYPPPQQSLRGEMEHEFYIFRRYFTGVMPGGTLPFSRKLMFWAGMFVQLILPYPIYSYIYGFFDALFPGNVAVQASSCPLLIGIFLICTMLNIQLLAFSIPKDRLILDFQWFLRILFQALLTTSACRALGIADSIFETAANRRVCNPALLARKKFISSLAFGAHVEGPLRASDDQAFLIFRYVWRPLCVSAVFICILVFMTVVAHKTILGVYIFFAYVAFLLSVVFGSTQLLVPDVYAGLVIFFERPFEEGDIVSLDKDSTRGGAISDIETSDVTGFVEYIGLRATVIRRFDQKATWVPNSHFIKSPVANWNSRPRKLIFIEFTASQRAPPEVLAAFQQKVQYLVQNHDDIDQEQYTKAAFVRLEGGLNFRLVCLTGRDVNKEALQQDLLLKITAISRKLDIQISMNQQSMYMIQEDVGHADYFLGEAKPTQVQQQLKAGGPEMSGILPAAKDAERTVSMYSPPGQLVVRIGSFDPSRSSGSRRKKDQYHYWAEIHLISDEAPPDSVEDSSYGPRGGQQDDVDRIPGRMARTRRVRLSDDLGVAPFLESLPLPLLSLEGLPIPPPRIIEARVMSMQSSWHGRHKPLTVGTALVDVAAMSLVTEPAKAVVLNNKNGATIGTLGVRIFCPEGTQWPQADAGMFVAPAPVDSSEPYESLGEMAARVGGGTAETFGYEPQDSADPPSQALVGDLSVPPGPTPEGKGGAAASVGAPAAPMPAPAPAAAVAPSAGP